MATPEMAPTGDLDPAGTGDLDGDQEQVVVRETDRRNGNAARARKQAARASLVLEDAAGNVHRQTATTLVIPEEKRCTATTLAGTRCKVGRMRGIAVCVFHSHLALDDPSLAKIADGQKPRLSPRKALQAVVQLRAGELAEAAVSGALDADAGARTKAVLALVDATDPLVQASATVSLTRAGVEAASFTELRALVAAADASAA